MSLPLEGGGPLAVEGVLYPNPLINSRLSITTQKGDYYAKQRSGYFGLKGNRT